MAWSNFFSPFFLLLLCLLTFFTAIQEEPHANNEVNVTNHPLVTDVWRMNLHVLEEQVSINTLHVWDYLPIFPLSLLLFLSFCYMFIFLVVLVHVCQTLWVYAWTCNVYTMSDLHTMSHFCPSLTPLHYIITTIFFYSLVCMYIVVPINVQIQLCCIYDSLCSYTIPFLYFACMLTIVN